MVMALGKAGKLCRVPGHCTRQRFFFKKQKIFAECQAGEALGKELFKKIKKWLCRVRAAVALGKEFFFKKNVFAECLAAAALGKEFLKKNKKCLCRVP